MTSMLQQPVQQTSAQPQQAVPTPPTPDDRATEFQAVNDTGEHFNGYTLMVEGYAAVWLVLMVWLVMLWRKQASLAQRVVGLEAAIDRAEKKLVAGAAKKAKAPDAEKTEAEPAKKAAEEPS